MVYLPYPIQCNAVKMIHIYFLEICGTVTTNGVTVPQPSFKLGDTVKLPLLNVTNEIFDWAYERKIDLSAEYIKASEYHS